MPLASTFFASCLVWSETSPHQHANLRHSRIVLYFVFYLSGVLTPQRVRLRSASLSHPHFLAPKAPWKALRSHPPPPLGPPRRGPVSPSTLESGCAACPTVVDLSHEVNHVPVGQRDVDECGV